MEISITLLLLVTLKLALLLGCVAVTALFCLWPINDQPTSRSQFIAWGCINAVVFVLIFTDLIKFTS